MVISAAACGGSHASGPSPVVVAPSSAPYTYTFERWQVGLRMHHCFGPGVNPAAAQWAADEMASASGVPQTLEGPCNVEWVVDAAEVDQRSTDGKWQAFTEAFYQPGTGNLVRLRVRMVFRSDVSLYNNGVHEGGHALGLVHSANKDDVMYPGSTSVRTFSERERALLADMYRVR